MGELLAFSAQGICDKHKGVSWPVDSPNHLNSLPGTDVIEDKSLCFDFVCKLSGHPRRTVASCTRLLNHRIALGHGQTPGTHVCDKWRSPSYCALSALPDQYQAGCMHQWPHV